MSSTGSTNPDRVIAACEKEWDSNKSDCSKFVRAVGADLGIHLTGLANDIVRYVRANWRAAADGPAAANFAANGMFVIGGLEHEPHGHVVVVVPGPLNRNKYPTAYWGQLGGVGKKCATINWAWAAGDRDRVEYRYFDFGAPGTQNPGSVQAKFIA